MLSGSHYEIYAPCLLAEHLSWCMVHYLGANCETNSVQGSYCFSKVAFTSRIIKIFLSVGLLDVFEDVEVVFLSFTELLFLFYQRL